jgi:hypothetical protein
MSPGQPIKKICLRDNRRQAKNYAERLAGGISNSGSGESLLGIVLYST